MCRAQTLLAAFVWSSAGWGCQAAVLSESDASVAARDSRAEPPTEDAADTLTDGPGDAAMQESGAEETGTQDASTADSAGDAPSDLAAGNGTDATCAAPACEPGASETRRVDGACVAYEQRRTCNDTCSFGPWVGDDPSVQCERGGTRICAGQEIDLPCNAAGNVATQVCNGSGVLVVASTLYGCTVQQDPGAGTRVCPNETFTRSCYPIEGGRARANWRCVGTESPSGGTFMRLDSQYCTASSGAEAGMHFCPGEVILRNNCPAARNYFICPEDAGEGTSFASEAELGCDIEGGEWEPVHRGVDLRRWTERGARFRALRIDLCDASLRIAATAEEDRRARTSSWGSENNMLAAINGGFFFFSNYHPDACVAFGGGEEWSRSADSAARSFIAFGRDNVYLSEAPTIDRPPYPGFEWKEEAVCGDATIVRGSRTVAGFNPADPVTERTAAGFSPDRRTLYFLTVDDPGRTVMDMGPPLVALGVDYAINLDGGGSTTMWVSGLGLVNRPGSERVVANHLGVWIEGGPRGYNCPR
ncbi:MAG: phosphodiester glycosidase family protein [Myxococcota bacterium]